MRIISLETLLDNSGFGFEDLICNLLKEEYGTVFEHTPLTNDGGRDFITKKEYVLTKGNTWAECKKYAKLLSFNDVSNTLLMAFIKKANKILIFSYSAVNRRFYKKVAEYKEQTNINVEIYDDINLEKLLLKYKDVYVNRKLGQMFIEN